MDAEIALEIDLQEKVEVKADPIRKSKELDTPMEISDGVFARKKTLDYVYFNDHTITKYYKEGFREEVAYTPAALAMLAEEE